MKEKEKERALKRGYIERKKANETDLEREREREEDSEDSEGTDGKYREKC